MPLVVLLVLEIAKSVVQTLPVHRTADSGFTTRAWHVFSRKVAIRVVASRCGCDEPDIVHGCYEQGKQPPDLRGSHAVIIDAEQEVVESGVNGIETVISEIGAHVRSKCFNLRLCTSRLLTGSIARGQALCYLRVSDY